MFSSSKKAIGMLELILSMVIISIIVLAIPRLISESTKSIGVVLQQESISINVSHTINVLNRYWDESIVGLSTNSPIVEILQPVVHTPVDPNMLTLSTFHQEGVFGLDRYYSGRGFKISGELIFPKANREINFGNMFDKDIDISYDDIDDYHDSNQYLESKINIVDDTQGEFIDKNINIYTTVTYASDFAEIEGGSTLKVNNIFTNRNININDNNTLIQIKVNVLNGLNSVKKQIEDLNLSTSIADAETYRTNSTNQITNIINSFNQSTKAINLIQQDIAILQQEFDKLSIAIGTAHPSYTLLNNLRNTTLINIRQSMVPLKGMIFTSNQTNIKFITASITSNNPDEILKKNITLYSFSCNIGSYYPVGKVYDAK